MIALGVLEGPNSQGFRALPVYAQFLLNTLKAPRYFPRYESPNETGNGLMALPARRLRSQRASLRRIDRLHLLLRRNGQSYSLRRCQIKNERRIRRPSKDQSERLDLNWIFWKCLHTKSALLAFRCRGSDYPLNHETAGLTGVYLLPPPN
jgi:hypothetical protein